MIKRPCDKTGCPQDATLEVCLRLRESKDGPFALTSPLLFLCADHSGDFTFDQFVDADPDNWPKLQAGFTALGRVPPKREFCDLLVRPMTGSGRIDAPGNIADN